MNRLSLVAGLILSFTTLYPKPSIAPKTHEFAWDLHDVVFEKSKSGVAKQGVKKGFTILKHLAGYVGENINYVFTGKTGKHQELIKKVRALRGSGATGQAYQEILNEVDPELGSMVQKMANEQYPIVGMKELIQELHELGYTQRVASNIGNNFFNNLAAKYPDIFNNFTDGKTVDYKKEPVIKKPDLEYFNEYQGQYPERKKIFVDDNKKNVLSALETGMIAIQFKNAKQLRKELSKLGINLKKAPDKATA